MNTIQLNTQSILNYPKQHSILSWRVVLLIVLLTLPLWVFAKTLDVFTDRQTVELGDIITLTIRADFQTRNSQLNLDNLKDQFEILGRQQSNQISIINGSFNSSTQWQITLLPKQEGDLIVPPLHIDGVQSAPYKIKVRPAPKKSITTMGNYFLESSLNKQQAYVQEEVLYRLKFYFLGAFQGNIRPPIFENSLTTTIKDQAVYGKNINGKNYTVYEWLYAFYPQKSGEVVIKGPIFSGIQQYRNRQKGVQEVAKDQTLTVLPEPIQQKSNPNALWLPAKSITLSETLTNTQQKTLRVGDSLTRTLTLTATGLRASQLPEIKTENQASFKVYSDQPVTEETLLDSGVRSVQQTKQTIIFTQAGKITLPEQRLSWFNTETQTMETAVIKARQLTVLPELNSSANTPSQPTQTPNTTVLSDMNSIIPSGVSRETSETSFVWPLITSLLGFAWFITLILWRKQTQKLKSQLQQLETNDSPNRDSFAVPLKQTSTAPFCNSSTMPEPSEFYKQLKKYLKENHSIGSLSDLENTDLKQGIYQLEEHLFSNTELPDGLLETLCKQLKEGAKDFPPPSQKEGKKGKQLASLYKH